MTPKFLYPFRKRIEMFGALYAGGFGMYIWALSALGHRSPILWVYDDAIRQMAIAQILVVAAFVHSLGIRINGHWRFSPVLRMAAMSAHSTIFVLMIVSGWGSSAAYTYSWVSGVMVLGVVSASRDFVRAMGWDAKWAET